MNPTSASRPFVDPRRIPSPTTSEMLNRHGGKATNLEALRDAGFSVPEFVVFQADLLSGFLAQYQISVATHPTAADCAGHIAAIREKPFSGPIRQKIQDIWGKMGGMPLCVRSSGTCEDLTGFSFAGQYETVLDIHSLPALEQAIRRCWASLFNTRVRQYLLGKGMNYSQAGMALIIQQYIPADHAGVCFTVNPLTGRQNQCLIEFTKGCGEALVSGQVNPETAIVDHADLQVVSGKLPPGLSLDQVSIFRKIQALFGSPQDIEWVISGNHLWIVQSRPITRIQVDASFGTWTTADFRDGGVSSSVCTPLMWSLYDYIWQYSMPEYFRIIALLDPGQEKKPWGGYFYGRPYWNLGEVVRCLLKVPGFQEKNLYLDLGINTAPDYPSRSVPFSPGILYAVLPTILKLEHYYEYRISRNRKFRRDFASLVEPFQKFLQGSEGVFSRWDVYPEKAMDGVSFRGASFARLSNKDFAKLFKSLITKVYFTTETSYFLTIYNTSNAKLDFKVHLDAINGEGHDLSYIKLISGLLRMKHLSPIRGLSQMAAKISVVPGLREVVLNTPPDQVESILARHPEGKPILGAMRHFIEEFGYHSSRELDISIPRWCDDHETVWRLLTTYLRDPDSESVIAHEKRQHALYRAEVARVRIAFSSFRHRLIPIQSRLFFRALLRTRNYCWWREEMRDYSSRVYRMIRQFAIEAENRLGLASGEIFWLSWQQVIDALSDNISPERIRALLGRSLEEARMFRLFENPDELGTGFLAINRGVSAAAAHGQLQGVGCCPGISEAVARVIPNLENIDRVRRGEILVTRFTDPGWTPIFHLLGGVVTETGGVLSHAAVISREYGIPAVLNVPGAVSRIKDGQKIRIDGSTGMVELL